MGWTPKVCQMRNSSSDKRITILKNKRACTIKFEGILEENRTAAVSRSQTSSWSLQACHLLTKCRWNSSNHGLIVTNGRSQRWLLSPRVRGSSSIGPKFSSKLPCRPVRHELIMAGVKVDFLYHNSADGWHTFTWPEPEEGGSFNRLEARVDANT